VSTFDFEEYFGKVKQKDLSPATLRLFTVCRSYKDSGMKNACSRGFFEGMIFASEVLNDFARKRLV